MTPAKAREQQQLMGWEVVINVCRESLLPLYYGQLQGATNQSTWPVRLGGRHATGRAAAVAVISCS